MSHEASLAAVAEDASDLADLGGELLLHGGQPLLVRLQGSDSGYHAFIDTLQART